MNAPVEVLPQIFVVEDLLPSALCSELLETCEASTAFKKTAGATLYRESLLSHISPGLNTRFHDWVIEACVPLVSGCLGLSLDIYRRPSRLHRALTSTGLLSDTHAPPSTLERLLHWRGVRQRLGPPKLEVSPKTFVTK